jgi:dienelactone hydrolase
MYIARPPEGTAVKANKAVLYLTDVMGLQLAQNKLLADSFARAGYLTVAPDMFNSTPALRDLNEVGPDTTLFLSIHTNAETDPVVEATMKYMRASLGVTRIGATGYCFGGRYSFRAATLGAQAAFAAHPSRLEDSEISAITAPASVAAAETDNSLTPEKRAAFQALLQKTGQPYSFAVYGGTNHGFAVRANVTDPKQKFAKEEAFFQAVRWFDTWL